jgi:hypothetical protein
LDDYWHSLPSSPTGEVVMDWKSDPMNQPEQNSLTALFQKNPTRYLLRLMTVFMVASLISLIFGIAFFLIDDGILMGILKIAPIWEPAYQLVMKLVGVQQNNIEFHPYKIPLWAIPGWILSWGLRVFMMGFGFWLLFHLGFQQQNLFYLLTSHHYP